MNILITGSNGFIGRHLVPFLEAQGETVLRYDFENGRDIFNDWMLNHCMRQVDLCIHLAGCTGVPISYQVPFDFYRVNTEGAARVFRAAANQKVKVIHASTGEVYTKNSPYAASKIGAEAAAEAERVTNNLDVVILRFLNPYGPGQPNKYVIPFFMNKARKGQPLTIHGTGEQRKDYIYISDLIEAIWEARKLPAGTITDVGSGQTTSINQIAEIVASLYPTQITHTQGGERPGETHDLTGNIQALTQIGWSAKVSITEGIKRVKEVIEHESL